MTPAEIRPHLGDFERKGYTSPTLMLSILKNLGVAFKRRADLLWPNFGLVRVQWAGPWTATGVPARVAYRHTHWVASCIRSEKRPDAVFDVNCGHWCNFEDWSTILVPHLLRECEPKASGEWWVTHSVEVRPS
jgi:hypothetical protein